MKKKILMVLVLAAAFLFCAPTGAFQIPDFAETSDQKTDDALILTGTGFFYGILVISDGKAAVTVDIYDNTGASGAKVIPTWVVPVVATGLAQCVVPRAPVACIRGIYVDITCAGVAKYAVYYRAR